MHGVNIKFQRTIRRSRVIYISDKITCIWIMPRLRHCMHGICSLANDSKTFRRCPRVPPLPNTSNPLHPGAHPRQLFAPAAGISGPGQPTWQNTTFSSDLLLLVWSGVVGTRPGGVEGRDRPRRLTAGPPRQMGTGHHNSKGPHHAERALIALPQPPTSRVWG